MVTLSYRALGVLFSVLLFAIIVQSLFIVWLLVSNQRLQVEVHAEEKEHQKTVEFWRQSNLEQRQIIESITKGK